jgi:hypothetical protein
MTLTPEQRAELEWLWRNLGESCYSNDQKKGVIRDQARTLPSRSSSISDDDFEGWWREKTQPPLTVDAALDERHRAAAGFMAGQPPS